ncbi:hypothetical protein [Actinokineospora globicatena]|uniref:hypothetical protein n=1 Tax=Actinokineospora globicatena TaxID=103729 RepID=UPI0020A53CFF|nr:hypothetical protein [Actinokineospora globicatena]MCP2304472.1 hypothetical protein [Actinokineospora globicatena]GLW78162.1 hypothetical protein Aglo01_26440 [Actinokineospora globicatena]GLW85172.1 hypothetical protein Aglo02_28120 [Actinokineospora globicatena]
MRSVSRRWMMPAALALVSAVAVVTAQPAAAAPPAYYGSATATGAEAQALPPLLPLPAAARANVNTTNVVPTGQTNGLPNLSAPVIGNLGSINTLASLTDTATTRTARAQAGITGVSLIAPLGPPVVSAASISSQAIASINQGSTTVGRTGLVTVQNLTVAGQTFNGVLPSQTIPVAGGPLSVTVHLNQQVVTTNEITVIPVRVVSRAGTTVVADVKVGEVRAKLSPTP